MLDWMISSRSAMISSNNGRSSGEITPSSAICRSAVSRCRAANSRTRLMMRITATGSAITLSGGKTWAATCDACRRCSTARYWLSYTTTIRYAMSSGTAVSPAS